MGGGNEHLGNCQIFFEPVSTYRLCFPLIYHFIAQYQDDTDSLRHLITRENPSLMWSHMHCIPHICGLESCENALPAIYLKIETTTERCTETLATSTCIAEKFMTSSTLGACHCDTLGFTLGSNSGSMTSAFCLGSMSQSLPLYPPPYLGLEVQCT